MLAVMTVLKAITPDGPRLPGAGVMTQRWEDLTFVHWPVPVEAVARLLPPGTHPDLHEGTAYVGLVPFVMTGVRLLGTPPVPHVSRFAETNVRLYAHDDTGRRGVVFLSLDAARLLPVLAAIAGYHLPYRWARMAVERDGDERAYTSRRRWPGPRGARSVVRVRVGPRLAPDPLAHFLTARWGLFSSWHGGRTAYAPVEHPPWLLHGATLLDLSEDLTASAGLPAAPPDPHVMWSPGVPARIGRPTLLR